MLGKVVLSVLTVTLSLMVWPASSQPLSEMNRIYLDVHPGVLSSYKIVLTLEPLAKGTENLAMEFQDSVDVAVFDGKKVIQEVDNVELLSTKTPVSGANVIDTLDPSTPKATEVRTKSPFSSSPSKRISNPTVPVTSKRIMVSRTSSVNPDIHRFVVTFPNVQCPEGYKPDPNGKCREIFTMFGGSAQRMADSNFLPRSGTKIHRKKYMKN